MLYCCGLYSAALAHEGHNTHDTEKVTIGRPTYVHFKSILSTYHEVYDSLSDGQLKHIPTLARILIDTAGKGIDTEPKGTGRHMMKSILEGAQGLKQAKTLREAQEAFALISEAISPFLKFWPGQLKSNETKLYQCRNHGHHWLQPQAASPACPYAYNETTECSVLISE